MARAFGFGFNPLKFALSFKTLGKALVAGSSGIVALDAPSLMPK
jgi:hypothetical protein